MIDPERLTVKAQQAIAEAQSLAAGMSHQEVDVEHLLYALVGQRDGVVAPLLQRMGARPEALEGRVREELEKRPKVEGAVRKYASARLPGMSVTRKEDS